MSVQVITCPEVLPKDSRAHTVFLAGGITGCPDWQSEFIALCENHIGHEGSKVSLVNPRRTNFDVNNPEMSKEQIRWEYDHLRKCVATIFWFPEETLCPITLYELGAALERDPFSVIIGCHPKYQRKFDVTYQNFLRRPTGRVSDSLEELVNRLLGKR